MHDLIALFFVACGRATPLSKEVDSNCSRSKTSSKKLSSTKLYNSVENTSVWDYVLISKVMQNYYLYRIAMLLGNKEQAAVHKNFVLENGGRLWYRTELMEKGMNDLHAIPNK